MLGLLGDGGDRECVGACKTWTPRICTPAGTLLQLPRWPESDVSSIVDCDTACDGCGVKFRFLHWYWCYCSGTKGGGTADAYMYVIKTGGLEYETDYPYTGENGPCKFNAADVGAKITGWT